MAIFAPLGGIWFPLYPEWRRITSDGRWPLFLSLVVLFLYHSIWNKILRLEYYIMFIKYHTDTISPFQFFFYQNQYTPYLRRLLSTKLYHHEPVVLACFGCFNFQPKSLVGQNRNLDLFDNQVFDIHNQKLWIKSG